MKRLLSLLSMMLIGSPAVVSAAAAPNVQTIEVTIQHSSLGAGGGYWFMPAAPAGFDGNGLIVTRIGDANKLKPLDKTKRHRCKMKLDSDFPVPDSSYVWAYPVFAIVGKCTPEPPSCSDSIKNQDESDIDCGGPNCAPCSDFRSCDDPSDCTSGICQNVDGGCFGQRLACVSAQCANGVQDPGEIGIDCGFIACRQGCDVGEACGTGCDCTVGHPCSGGVCQ